MKNDLNTLDGTCAEIARLQERLAKEQEACVAEVVLRAAAESERDVALTRCRLASQRIIEAIGSVGPENIEDAALRIVAKVVTLTEELTTLRETITEL